MQLWKHQEDTVKWMEDTGFGHIFLEAGTGKTLIVLTYLIKNNLPALILCPKTLVQSAWESDINKFFPDFTDYEVAYANKRQEQFEKQPQILITNFEAVNWITQKKSRSSRVMPNMKYCEKYKALIIDEATAFKNGTAKRTKSCRILAKTMDKKFFMTGTPFSKSVEDVWCTTLMLDKGERLGHTVSGFRYSFMDALPVPGAPRGVVKYVDKKDSVQRVTELLADISICYRREECLDLPDNQVIWVNHKLGKPGEKFYNDMRKHAVAQDRKGELVTGVNKAVVRNKLLQACSGAVYDEYGDVKDIDDSRTELLVELCKERDHTVVFFVWRHQREAYKKALEKEGMKVSYIDGTVSAKARAEVVKDFQDGKHNVILLHPATAAHGITLTKSATVIFSTPPADRAEFYEQCVARVNRGGQVRKTETIIMYTQGTIEKAVYQAIIDNANIDDTFLNAIKSLSNL